MFLHVQGTICYIPDVPGCFRINTISVCAQKSEYVYSFSVMTIPSWFCAGGALIFWGLAGCQPSLPSIKLILLIVLYSAATRMPKPMAGASQPSKLNTCNLLTFRSFWVGAFFTHLKTRVKSFCFRGGVDSKPPTKTTSSWIEIMKESLQTCT